MHTMSHEVCWGFSVLSKSFSTRSRSTNKFNTSNNNRSLNNLSSPNSISNQPSNMTRHKQSPKRCTRGKLSRTIPQGKRTCKQCTRGSGRVVKLQQKLVQKRTRGTLLRTRSEPMTTPLPTKMPKPAMISTNRTRHETTKTSRQHAEGPHHSTNKSTRAPNINAWTQRNSRH